MAKPTLLENLIAARENYAAQLAELSDPSQRKPSYTAAGRSMDWVGYGEYLRKAIAELKEAIDEENGAAGEMTVTSIGGNPRYYGW